jgi:hypothetical protein
MGNPAENERNGKQDALAPDAANRIAELEGELEGLRERHAELQRKHDYDRQLLQAYMLADFPQSEEESRELAATARPFGELLERLDREFGSEPAQ